mgnify:CR=1 FL=1
MTVVGCWADLVPRLLSSLVMVTLGGAALYTGGIILAILMSAVCAVMIWEVIGLLAPQRGKRPVVVAILFGVVFFVATWASVQVAAVVGLFAVLAVRLSFVPNYSVFAPYCALIYAGALGVFELRVQAGLGTVIWLITIVVITDLAGYFVGRLIGGAKIWPSVSPKKTWSGTVAGWICVALAGLLFLFFFQDAHWMVLPISIFLSAVSQAGDMLESHLKRLAGVKDSSQFIPGHGGFLDRFDGMIAVAAAGIALQLLISPTLGF